MHHPWTDEEVNLILREVASESDRGCVLLCGALLDRGLEGLLRLNFRNCSGAEDGDIDKVLTDLPAAPLLNFASRIRVAHLLGLIDKPTSTALRQLAKF